MNFRWNKMSNEEFEMIDTWDSEDIREFVTFDREFYISDYYTMFGYKDSETSYIARDEDGTPMGILLYHGGRKGDKPRSFDIQLLVVNPEFAGRGVGTKMLSDILERYKDEFDFFRMSVEHHNVACIKLCKKLGLNPVGKKRRHSTSQMYELRVKELTKKIK